MRYIRALKLDCSPAGDGIESEHLRYGIETQIPMHISNMLSLCIRYSVVPDTNGLLIPIPKKPGCDTSVHGRPQGGGGGNRGHLPPPGNSDMGAPPPRII